MARGTKFVLYLKLEGEGIKMQVLSRASFIRR